MRQHHDPVVCNGVQCNNRRAVVDTIFFIAILSLQCWATAECSTENSTAYEIPLVTNITSGSGNCTSGKDGVYSTPSATPTSRPSLNGWHYLGYVSVPTLLIIGVGGNTMTIIVMRHNQFKSSPFSYILIALALSDTALNVLSPFTRQFIREAIGRDIRAISGTTCIIYFWCWRMSKMTSSWLVVAISVERLIAVLYPLKASRLITKRIVLSSIGAIYLTLAIYNACWGVVVDRVINGACIPNTRPEEAKLLSLTLIVIGCCLYSFLPTLLLIINTGRTIAGLRVAGAQAAEMRGGECNTYDKITRMLLAVCGVFVVLVLPITIGHLLAIIDEISILEDTNVAITVFREVAQLAEQINYSINFFLYATCSSLFRQRLMHMGICCQRLANTNHTKSPETSLSRVSSQNTVS